MTPHTGGSHAGSTFHDRLATLLRTPGPLDVKALLATLDAEVAARETHAYKAGWNDALAELHVRRA
ncbi:hypothetical protein [Streptomyces sp. NPDC047315]|uniref:hypothetical protein n=1 Tax=Streptomyces sp. NPDC047315 TaxID=3155142 RepID=UPI0033C6E868